MELQKEKIFKHISLTKDNKIPFYKKTILKLNIIHLFYIWTFIGVLSVGHTLRTEEKNVTEATSLGKYYSDNSNKFIENEDYHAAIIEMNKMVGVNYNYVDNNIMRQVNIIKSRTSDYDNDLDKIVNEIKNENRKKLSFNFIPNNREIFEDGYNPITLFIKHSFSERQKTFNEQYETFILEKIEEYEYRKNNTPIISSYLKEIKEDYNQN